MFFAGNGIDTWPTQEIEKIWVPVYDDKVPRGYRLEQQPILFPHRVMEYVFNECGLDLDMADINQFWDNAIRAGESYASHEMRHRVPLGFYGDAAQLITKVRVEKLLCFWMNIVIFRPKSIRFSRFLLWSCDVSKLLKNRTAYTILRWIVWSLNALHEGTHPTTRPGNRPLESQAEKDRAGTWLTHQQYQFSVVELRGDWEFHKMIWQYKCSWKGGVRVGICFRCPAMARSADPGELYWNMDENSTWAQNGFDTTDYICKRLPSRNIWTSIDISSIWQLKIVYILYIYIIYCALIFIYLFWLVIVFPLKYRITVGVAIPSKAHCCAWRTLTSTS